MRIRIAPRSSLHRAAFALIPQCSRCCNGPQNSICLVWLRNCRRVVTFVKRLRVLSVSRPSCVGCLLECSRFFPVPLIELVGDSALNVSCLVLVVRLCRLSAAPFATRLIRARACRSPQFLPLLHAHAVRCPVIPRQGSLLATVLFSAISLPYYAHADDKCVGCFACLFLSFACVSFLLLPGLSCVLLTSWIVLRFLLLR